MPGSKQVSNLCRWVLCVFEGMLSTSRWAVYNPTWSFTCCLLRASTLGRGKSLGCSQVFPEHTNNPGHSPMQAHGLLDSQEYWGALQSSYPIRQVLLLSFLISLLFVPYVIHHLPQCDVWQCLWLFSTNAPKEVAICIGWALIQVK